MPSGKTTPHADRPALHHSKPPIRAVPRRHGIDLIDLGGLTDSSGASLVDNVTDLLFQQVGDDVVIKLDLDGDGNADKIDFNGDGAVDPFGVRVLNTAPADLTAADFMF